MLVTLFFFIYRRCYLKVTTHAIRKYLSREHPIFFAFNVGDKTYRTLYWIVRDLNAYTRHTSGCLGINYAIASRIIYSI